MPGPEKSNGSDDSIQPQFRKDEFYELDEERMYREECERVLDGLPCFKKKEDEQ